MEEFVLILIIKLAHEDSIATIKPDAILSVWLTMNAYSWDFAEQLLKFLQSLTLGLDLECTFIHVLLFCWTCTMSPCVGTMSLWGSNQIMNRLCVLSAYNRFRHVQKNLVSISAIGPETLSSYCLMKYTASKAKIFSIRGETVVQGNEKKLSLIRKPSPRTLATLCCMFCIESTKETHPSYKMFNLSAAPRNQI